MSTFLCPNPRTEGDKSNFTISLATWNVQGLNAAEKWQQLGRDCAKYHLNLTCLQETKVAANDDLELASGHKLVLIQQQTAKYRGSRLCHCPSIETICHLVLMVLVMNCYSMLLVFYLSHLQKSTTQSLNNTLLWKHLARVSWWLYLNQVNHLAHSPAYAQ